MKTVKIYVLKDPSDNNIFYVGRSVNIKTRYGQHIFLARQNKYKNKKDAKICSILNRRLKPIIEIIDELPQEPIQVVKDREMYWITEYRKKYDLKNDRDFVDNGYLFSEESRKKMSDSHKNYYLTHESSCKGRTLTDVQKNNISNGMKNVKRSSESYVCISKPVLQFSKDNIFIKEWISGSCASNELNISQSNINLVCNNKRQTAGNFKWKFKTII